MRRIDRHIVHSRNVVKRTGKWAAAEPRAGKRNYRWPGDGPTPPPKANPEEETMMLKALLATALLAAVATPVLADDFYVVQDVKTKKCTIVDKKPTTTTVTQVGPMAFKTRTEDEPGMKKEKICVEK
jgi:hypothetical protein